MYLTPEIVKKLMESATGSGLGITCFKCGTEKAYPIFVVAGAVCNECAEKIRAENPCPENS